MSSFQNEVDQGTRFEFGKNWTEFLRLMSPARIELAEVSLKRMLGVTSLQGKSFLDIGSGSGLFSLAARKLGATVRSFDYDPASVECTRELRRRYSPDDPDWIIEEGSVLEPQYLASLGKFDVVYSWGVLHHTGAMWQALENVVPLVARQGCLFIAIYNDQGPQSVRWRAIHKFYNELPKVFRPLFLAAVMGPRELRALAGCTLRGKPWQYFNYVRNYSSGPRGMSYWHDMIDWMGGYPFDVAKPEQILRFFRDRGFRLTEMKTCGGGIGCNEYVFQADRVEVARREQGMRSPAHHEGAAGSPSAAGANVG